MVMREQMPQTDLSQFANGLLQACESMGKRYVEKLLKFPPCTHAQGRGWSAGNPAPA